VEQQSGIGKDTRGWCCWALLLLQDMARMRCVAMLPTARGPGPPLKRRRPRPARRHARRAALVKPLAAAAQEGLAAALRAVLWERLAQVGWPPPVAAAAAAATDAGGAGAPSGAGWHGLEEADAQVVADVTRVMAAFIALQRSMQREAFDAVRPPRRRAPVRACRARPAGLCRAAARVSAPPLWARELLSSRSTVQPACRRPPAAVCARGAPRASASP